MLFEGQLDLPAAGDPLSDQSTDESAEPCDLLTRSVTVHVYWVSDGL